jgi:enolase
MYAQIVDVIAREVLDSRGTPTVEVEVWPMEGQSFHQEPLLESLRLSN